MGVAAVRCVDHRPRHLASNMGSGNRGFANAALGFEHSREHMAVDEGAGTVDGGLQGDHGHDGLTRCMVLISPVSNLRAELLSGACA